MSVAERVDGDHFELLAEAAELLLQIRPDDRQWFIEEITEALRVAAETKNFAQLQRVLQRVVVGYQTLGDTIVAQAAEFIR